MNYILSHCDSDGRFAAFCAFLALKDQGQTVFKEVQYGEDFPIDMRALTKEDAVYILDFSYKREILSAIYPLVGKLVVLDHHESAEKELEGLPYAHFDMTKSGALLAWEYFNPNTPPPMVCLLVNDRDLWKKEYPQSRHLEAYLRFKRIGLNWGEWDLLTHMPQHLEKCLEVGRLITEVEDSMINKVFKSRIHKIVPMVSQDRPLYVCFYNCPGLMHSELAEKFYTEYNVDVTIGWRVINNGKVLLLNLRSPNRVNVSEMAILISKQPGGLSGGGHAAAAGATMELDAGFKWLQKWLSAAEVTP